MKELNLGKEKISKLLLTFSIPCVISMLINSVYNIVDQIFIGKGVGTLGNAATNVIFPLVIMFNAIAGLIGNGAAANLSLKLGEGDKKSAAKSIGSSITLTLIVSLVVSVIAYIMIPKLVYFFGCTGSVYKYAVDYGRIVIIGAPFMIMYSSMSSIIRADGSPAYSMVMLVVGAIINIILDPIFIFIFRLGVSGGAIATVIGQVVSFIIAFAYFFKVKSVTLKKKYFKIDKDILRVLSLGLSVYGVISKINSLYISTVLGISIGAQPIIGFNYGAGNEERVKETIRKVLIINFIVGIIFNIIFILFPRELASVFISSTDPSYELFMEFAELMCHSFLLVICLNALEMTTSIVIQSVGNVFKSTAVSFIRQIILLIPISLVLAFGFNKGLYGVMYAGCIADAICFVITSFILLSEYKKLGIKESKKMNLEANTSNSYNGKHVIVTISREYGSGGRFVGKLVSEKLGIPFYDKEIINLASKKSGLNVDYIESIDQTKGCSSYINNNDDLLYVAEEKVIKSVSKDSCVIVGRCADYILRKNKDLIKVFLYSDPSSKEKRAILYYGLKEKNVLKEIEKIDKEREKHYKFYTGTDWKNFSNYDIMLNVDKYGVEKTADIIVDYINNLNK